MKILYVIHSFPPFHWRGTEVYALELAGAMAASHEAHVFYLRDDPEARAVTLEHDAFRDLPVHRARMRINPADPETYFFHAAQEGAFSELLNSLRPDVVHFVYYTGGLSLKLPRLAGRSGARVLLTVTDFSGLCPRGQLLDDEGVRCRGPREGLRCVPCLFKQTALTKQPWLDYLLREYAPLKLAPAGSGRELGLMRRRLDAVRAAFGQAELVIYPNANAMRLYHGSGVKAPRERVMDYGIDTAPFREHRKSAAAFARIGFIGQLLPHKGLHVLARALSGLTGEWKLIIHGSLDDPGAREYYESLELDPERAEFRGTFPFERMNRVLEGIDVLVAPSLWDENCPLIVKYALATGTFAVLADQPGMVADRSGIRRARFFKPGDAEALRDALKEAMERSQAPAGPALNEALESRAIIDIKDQAAELEKIYKGGAEK
ncbi:MAG TPA: glycosyltransferase [bacterium]|nr:glycosyltransferase [bacterium]